MTNLKIAVLFFLLAIVVGSWYLTCAAAEYDDVTAGFFELEPRHFDRLTVITVGTGGAHEDHNRAGPATAVGHGDEILLVDAGRGLADALRHAKIPMAQPAAVLLTGVLPENMVGLDDLLAASWLEGRRERIVLVGPVGTELIARSVEAATRPGIEAWSRGLAQEMGDPGFDVIEIEDGWTQQSGDLSVRAGALPGGPVPAFAYRFEWRGRAVVVGGVGFNDAALTELSRGAHMLVHEGPYIPTPDEARDAGLAEDPAALERQATMHTTMIESGQIAQQAGVGTLVLVRLRPPPVYDLQVTQVVSDFFGGTVVVAADGDELTP